MIIRYHATPNVAIALCLFFPVLFGLELRMNFTTSGRMPTYFARDFYYLWQSKHSAVVYVFWIWSNVLSVDTGWSIAQLNNTFLLRAVEARNRVSVLIPWDPKSNAAAIPRPSAIPTAAITGTRFSPRTLPVAQLIIRLRYRKTSSFSSLRYFGIFLKVREVN